MKPFLLITGFLAAVLIVAQLVMGQLIVKGQASLRKAHQHSGYLTVAVTLIYIGWSLAAIASSHRNAEQADDRTESEFRSISHTVEDRLDGPFGGELAEEEPGTGLVAEERAGAGGPRLR